jgi:hypothetical protein
VSEWARAATWWTTSSSSENEVTQILGFFLWDVAVAATVAVPAAFAKRRKICTRPRRELCLEKSMRTKLFSKSAAALAIYAQLQKSANDASRYQQELID